MNSIIQKYLVLICSLFCLTACEEFIEPSIQDRKVAVLAPKNGTESSQYLQTFWWELVNDALHYRLQVVSPNFSQTQRLVLDTLINTNKFNFTLEPGNYQWRVRGENGSSQTSYASASFVVYASSITQQQPQLQSPANNALTASDKQVFTWLKLYGATRYNLQIDTNNFASENSLFLDQTTSNLEFPVTFIRDKVYQWRVKALNDTASSKWSTVQRFTFDSTPPDAVVLSSPATGASVTAPVTLSWTAISGAPKYQLYLYKSDQNTLYNSTFPITITGTSYAFTGLSGEKLYWKVRAIDAAGNTGAFSEWRNFTIQ